MHTINSAQHRGDRAKVRTVTKLTRSDHTKLTTFQQRTRDPLRRPHHQPREAPARGRLCPCPCVGFCHRRSHVLPHAACAESGHGARKRAVREDCRVRLQPWHGLHGRAGALPDRAPHHGPPSCVGPRWLGRVQILCEQLACDVRDVFALYSRSVCANQRSSGTRLNFRKTHRGRGVNEEDSLNQNASNRSGSLSVPGVARETTRSVQFSVHPDAKTGDPLNIIELDMVGSRMEVYDDEVSSQCPPHCPGYSSPNEYTCRAVRSTPPVRSAPEDLASGASLTTSRGDRLPCPPCPCQEGVWVLTHPTPSPVEGTVSAPPCITSLSTVCVVIRILQHLSFVVITTPYSFIYLIYIPRPLATILYHILYML